MKKRRRVNKKRVTIFFIFLLAIIGGLVFGGYKLVDKYFMEDKTNENAPKNEEETKPVEEEPEEIDDGIPRTGKGFKIEEIDGVTYIDGLLIANKTYSLPKDYKPKNPHTPISSAGYCMDCIEDDIYEKFEIIRDAAAKEGIKLWIKSGYRSYNVQKQIYVGKINSGGQEYADNLSARPGHSEHQTGLCFDLNSTSQSFARTKEGIWLNENAHKYGFIIRYPEGKKNETGYDFEPWHLRYVGNELAEKLYNNGDWITLEDYFGITSVYQEPWK